MPYQPPPEWNTFSPTAKRRILDAYFEYEKSLEACQRSSQDCEESRKLRNKVWLFCFIAFMALMAASALIGPIGHR